MHESRDIIKIFEEHKNMVYRLALSYLKNVQDAEDVVQFVFLKLIDGKANIISGKERALLTQITVNHCKDILRSFWRKNKQQLSDTIMFEDKAENELFNAVISLPPKYRIVIYLHYYEGYSLTEISVLLKIGTSGVSMRLHRARKILKDKLEGDYNES